MRWSQRLLAAGVVAALLTSCGGSPAPTVTPTVTPASSQTATASPSPSPSAEGTSSSSCSVKVEPEVWAPGGWGLAVGSGFKPGESISWSQAAEDGTLSADWDTDGFEPMRPDVRGGFGFALGAPGKEGVGHTITATIASPSCTAHASWRIEAQNEQTTPLAAQPAVECATARTAVEREDDVGEHQVHLIYALPSGATDRALDTNGQLAASFDHIQAYLRDRIDGHAFRLDTCDGGLDISFVEMPRTAQQYAAMRAGFTAGLGLDLVRTGFRYGQKLYVVAWDGLSQWARLGDGCGGEAGFQGVAVLFLRSTVGDTCPPLGVELPIGEPDTGLAHEIIHLLGLPAQCGANVDEGGHVTDDRADLMYGMGHTAAAAIDADHDDYYLHDIVGCPDLADSAFLDPLPDNAQLPVNWPAD